MDGNDPKCFLAASFVEAASICFISTCIIAIEEVDFDTIDLLWLGLNIAYTRLFKWDDHIFPLRRVHWKKGSFWWSFCVCVYDNKTIQDILFLPKLSFTFQFKIHYFTVSHLNWRCLLVPWFHIVNAIQAAGMNGEKRKMSKTPIFHCTLKYW